MKFCQQVSHLLMRGKWKGKVISHDLDRFISVSKTNDGSIVETELVRHSIPVCVCVCVCLTMVYTEV